jgi:hypothetical protein
MLTPGKRDHPGRLWLTNALLSELLGAQLQQGHELGRADERVGDGAPTRDRHNRLDTAADLAHEERAVGEPARVESGQAVERALIGGLGEPDDEARRDLVSARYCLGRMARRRLWGAAGTARE